MKFLRNLWLALVLVIGLVPAAAMAGANDPLFVNLTSDDTHRVNMALGFGKNQLERGHPLTVFLNDRAVFVASQANAGKFAEQHKAIGDLAAKGATIIACPFCMKHYGIKEADLLPSIKLGHPDLTGGALFKDNTKTMTW